MPIAKNFYSTIPVELKTRNQWLGVKLVPKPNNPDKTDKIPLDCHNGNYASYTNPKTWDSFQNAVHLSADGIGYVLTEDDPYTIIDIDSDMPQSEAIALIEHVDSYAEISQSNKGYHIIVKGKLPASISPNSSIQIFTNRHYVMLTGKVYKNYNTIQPRQEILTELYNFYKSEQRSLLSYSTGKEWNDEPYTDEEITIQITDSPQSQKANDLFMGRVPFGPNTLYPSQSEVDYAFLSILAVFSKSDAQVKRIFSYSKLYRPPPAKAPDYLDRSLSKIRANSPNMDNFKNFTSNTIKKGSNMNKVNSDAEPASDEWPQPQPLTVKVPPAPYPIEALPSIILAAVEEVAGFVKAPLPLVASSALAAVSLACQAHIDVKRAENLHGPVGLFLLTIADSGERKSTCDTFFTKAIRDYEAARAEAAKPALNNHRAAIEAWEAKRSGIKEQIRQLAKVNKSTKDAEEALSKLEHDKPKSPRFPRLLYADATPEALAYGLATQWPSGGMVSAEAGTVFGSHGMGKDSVMRNLSQLNQLWDGTSLTIDRRTTDSYTVRGARLTVALQVQEPTLREFFIRSGELARGTGFMARFLVAWPQSTQGYRHFTEAPTNWPRLAAFNQRITEILNQPVPINEDGALTPAMLSLAPDAKVSWVAYHDEIEGALASGGALYDVRDVASKSADNAVRLAALFQLFEHGNSGAISVDSFERASQIAAWHLSESRRFFGELALPAELADTARLDSWLIEHCRGTESNNVAKNHVRQHGPMRDVARLDAAIRELTELDRLRLEKDGKRQMIRLNPALLGETP